MGDPQRNDDDDTIEEESFFVNKLWRILDVFVNTLDLKTFMRLAITNKEIYERCMTDGMIKLNHKDSTSRVTVSNGVPRIKFYSSFVKYKKLDSYLRILRQLKCNLSLLILYIKRNEVDEDTITETRLYLEEIGVRKIDQLKIDTTRINGWPSIVSLIKKFCLKDLEFHCDLPEDLLRSFLQSDLNQFFYDRPIQGKLLLEIESPIPELEFQTIEATADVFMQILWKIQTGPLKKLSAFACDIPWDNFASVRSDYDDPLPAERPLLLIGYDQERWFLHWDGSVTYWQAYSSRKIFSKCEKKDFPPILQPKERLHEALAELCRKKDKDTEIECPKWHFTSFFDGIPVLDSSQNGEFPAQRPLLCKIGPPDGRSLKYCLLNESGSADVYLWNRRAEYDEYDLEERWPDAGGHLPLQRFLLKKKFEKHVEFDEFDCESKKEFRLLFKEYKPLPHDFKGQLPERRPLVFKSHLDKKHKKKEDYRVIVYDDEETPVLYRFDYSEKTVFIESCPSWNLPLRMIKTASLRQIAFNAPSDEFVYKVEIDMFHDALKGVKTIPFHAFEDFPTERPLILKKTELHEGKLTDHRLLVLENGFVRKCEWQDGNATLSRANPREFPLFLTKTLLTDFFKGEDINTELGFYIDRYILKKCQKHFNYIIPYDTKDSKVHYDDHPIIFEKTEIKHTCQKNPDESCDCMEEILRLCFISTDEDVIYITWEDRFLSFDRNPNPDVLPPILKTKETLEYLLEYSWSSEERKIKWYGSYEDFVAYFEGQKMTDFNYEGPLPETRPIFFKKYDSDDNVYWYLGEDDELFRCEKKDSYIQLTINPKYDRPKALSSSS